MFNPGGYNNIYSLALHFQIRHPLKQTRVPKQNLVYSGTPSLLLLQLTQMTPKQTRVPKFFLSSIPACFLLRHLYRYKTEVYVTSSIKELVGIYNLVLKQTSTLVPAAAEVGKIQFAEVPENRYDYTLPFNPFILSHNDSQNDVQFLAKNNFVMPPVNK